MATAADATSRRCPKCRLTRPLNQFPRSRSTSSGYYAYCRPCSAERQRQRRRLQPPTTLKSWRGADVNFHAAPFDVGGDCWELWNGENPERLRRARREFAALLKTPVGRSRICSTEECVNPGHYVDKTTIADVGEVAWLPDVDTAELGVSRDDVVAGSAVEPDGFGIRDRYMSWSNQGLRVETTESIVGDTARPKTKLVGKPKGMPVGWRPPSGPLTAATRSLPLNGLYRRRLKRRRFRRSDPPPDRFGRRMGFEVVEPGKRAIDYRRPPC